MALGARREAGRRLEHSAEVSEIDTDLGEPYAPERKVSGWVGTPDPTKYAPGTNYLSPEELEQEIAAGNVVAADDWREALKQLEPWQLQLLQQMAVIDYAKNRCVQACGRAGGRVHTPRQRT